MNIRKIQIQELLPALHLAAEVFAEDVAPAYTDEGVGRFHEFISYDSFREMFERQEVTIFGAFEGVQICGMIAVTNNGHIKDTVSDVCFIWQLLHLRQEKCMLLRLQ